MGNLKVKDEEYNEYFGAIQDFASAMEEDLISFINVLTKLCSTGVVDGSLAEKLKTFSFWVLELSGKTDELANDYMAPGAQTYLQDIDTADRNLY